MQGNIFSLVHIPQGEHVPQETVEINEVGMEEKGREQTGDSNEVWRAEHGHMVHAKYHQLPSLRVPPALGTQWGKWLISKLRFSHLHLPWPSLDTKEKERQEKNKDLENKCWT